MTLAARATERQKPAMCRGRDICRLCRSWVEGEGEMTMRALVILTAICFSTSAYAQDAAPKVGNRPLVQVKPKKPMGCKLVGTVRGTKLWAGDCAAAPELRGATPSAEPEAPAPTPEANPPAEKQ